MAGLGRVSIETRNLRFQDPEKTLGVVAKISRGGESHVKMEAEIGVRPTVTSVWERQGKDCLLEPLEGVQPTP